MTSTTTHRQIETPVPTTAVSAALVSPPAASPAVAAVPEPITLRDIGHELREDYLQWHSGALGTLVDLTLRPDRVARAYLFERDERYVRPLRYLLASVAVTMAVSWYALGRLQARDHAGVHASSLQGVSFVVNHAELLTLLMLPILAAIMRGAFHGLRVRYIDALVVLAYTQAQVNLASLLLLGTMAVSDNPLWQVPSMAAMLFYLLWAWAGFAQGPAWRRWLAACATLVLGQAINFLVVNVAAKFA
ncbi:MAG TPA: DUF3667 domain-containing protein [Xanthomonadaceae bacterium]|jgi:hypothetical protein|nr:DUF3667 domain-containing protein [Xanthomonadaceae bacterium]